MNNRNLPGPTWAWIGIFWLLEGALLFSIHSFSIVPSPILWVIGFFLLPLTAIGIRRKNKNYDPNDD